MASGVDRRPGPEVDHLKGASVFEQELYDMLVTHEHDERKIIAEYQGFADQTQSEAVRYLVDLILEDEHRHHWLLRELANRVRAMATFEICEPRVPQLDVEYGDDALQNATRHFLEVERKDQRELRRLARRVGDLGSELDSLVVELLQADTERHIRILQLIGTTAARRRGRSWISRCLG